MQEQPLVLSKVVKCSIHVYKGCGIFASRRDQKITPPHNPQSIVYCMVTYNYNLESDRSMRSNPENLVKVTQIIDIDEELIEDDAERIELHNWLTDSENSDQSDSNR